MPTEQNAVSAERMREVYEKQKTPYKTGAVLKFDDMLCDSPIVFRHGNAWYMSYIKIDRNCADSGYESHLAKSEDLVHWEPLFCTFPRKKDGSWDSRQTAAYAAFVHNDLGGDFEIQKVNGKYYFSYLGGNLDGYETDPLMTGEASADDLLNPASYRRFDAPILKPTDPDARPGERLTLFKSDFFIDEKMTLGHRYVNLYNAKDADNVESIFLAASDDGEHWQRYGDSRVYQHPDTIITGDPIVLTDGDLYIMVYFILTNEKKTVNTFAASCDLVHWTRWDGEPLIQSEYEWENLYAHKPSIAVKDGVVYHYYCACNTNNERFIALATSKPVEK